MYSGRLNHLSLTPSASYDSDSPHGSPRPKMVGTCMNCSYTFRLGSSESSEFCSKDCQTCYLIYISNPAHTPRKKVQPEKTNKQLVYEFQKELDRKNEEREARSDESEKMVEAHELPMSSPGKMPTKLKRMAVPTSPAVRIDRQPTTPMRVLR